MTSFFPSRTVSLYMGRMFLVRTFGILAGLVLVLQALDLLGESGKILAAQGNGDAQVWYYVTLRAPQIIARFLPFSVLLGTILTLITMNQNSEVVALKGAGMSAHQVLAPLIVASMGVAVLSFAFNDRIVPRATATLNRWQKVDYGPMPVDRGDRTNVWVRSGPDLIEVDTIRGRGNAAELGGITVYDRQGGALRAIVTAPRGRRAGDGWVVAPTQRFDVASGKVSQLGETVIARGVTPDQFTLASVDADELSFGALREAIGDLKAAGRPTKALEGSLWHKLSGPLSSVLMPLLGAVAAFGIARSGKLFVRAVIGMALGFAYFVADNFALAMGNLGAYPPFLAAWAPFLLFLFIGETVLLRTEE
ncbi:MULTISPECIES: LPS export ABC transporter permease LptG [unclassified Sphingomonas]|uniref:LPS export ABC transporter permease LptG n=1 Tax=unclassified Sphingomonas TaxID=196159 RepID=UPI00092C504F|nr:MULTISPECIES: LPS export ABC transporter permease LptG [unclassified Sphingomonas]MBN8848127.1 LPS export ABC transporter permease LptG [Sphingomonas sp.]OJV31907.1 MAG: LPS export ABC transporter permease LptG [Sphingomonas sp. 67-36]